MNLVVVYTTLVAIVILVVGLVDAWGSGPVWDKEWVPKPGSNPTHSADWLIEAIGRARDAYEYSDVSILSEALQKDFVPTGKMLVRFNSDEVIEICLYVSLVVAMLIIPLSTNYVRHGVFRLWNRKRSNQTVATTPVGAPH